MEMRWITDESVKLFFNNNFRYIPVPHMFVPFQPIHENYNVY